MAKKTSTPKRVKIPLETRRQLLLEVCYRCANPRCNGIITLNAHHIIHVEEGGSNDPDNLLVLCGHCHDMYHAGHYSRAAIKHWKSILVALNHAFGRAPMDLLLFLHRTSNTGWYCYSADGLVAFAPLIAAGLVEVYGSTVAFNKGSAGGNMAQSSHRVQLTKRGELLLDAWLSGNARAYNASLAEGVLAPVK